MTDNTRLYARDVAEVTGLSWESVRTYRKRGEMPEPDGWDGIRPWWLPETITAWDATRPSVRGGRPRATTVTEAATSLRRASTRLTRAVKAAHENGMSPGAISTASGLSKAEVRRRLDS